MPFLCENVHANQMRSAQWLRPYSLKQVSKAAEYMRNEAEVVGQLVWHSPTMQSDILFLAK